MRMEISTGDLDRIRQWFDVVRDVSPAYLDEGDYTLSSYIEQQLHLAYAQDAGEIR